MLAAVLVFWALGAARAEPPSDVLHLQVLLDRAHFSPGEIDGKDGSNTERAMKAFQKKHGLVAPATRPSKETWAALKADDTPALVSYTLTDADVSGPYAPVPEDMMDKSKLERLHYASALEALAERFHASPELLKRLNPRASLDRAGEELQVPNVHADPPDKKASRIVVAAEGFSLTVYDGDDKVMAYYPASMGSEHDPLPVGDWKVKAVLKDPPFFYNPDLFWDADEAHAKVKVPPGPNNPVGVVWIDLTKEHYGIHGTPEPSHVGKTQSHGCIRLTNWDAAELATLVAKGTPAQLVREGR